MRGQIWTPIDNEAGFAREDAIEPCRQGGLARLGWTLAIGFEIAIEPPDQCANFALRLTLLIGEGVELVNEALGMDPAQAVLADIELTGVVTDDDGVGQKVMGFDAAPQGAFGGDRDRIGGDFERRDAEPIEMCGPGCVIGEELVRVLGHGPRRGSRSGRRSTDAPVVAWKSGCRTTATASAAAAS